MPLTAELCSWCVQQVWPTEDVTDTEEDGLGLTLPVDPTEGAASGALTCSLTHSLTCCFLLVCAEKGLRVSEEDEHHGERYKLGRKFEGGGHGEIWRAYKVGVIRDHRI